jgi:hypothetical protein
LSDLTNTVASVVEEEDHIIICVESQQIKTENRWPDTESYLEYEPPFLPQ